MNDGISNLLSAFWETVKRNDSLLNPKWKISVLTYNINKKKHYTMLHFTTLYCAIYNFRIFKKKL